MMISNLIKITYHVKLSLLIRIIRGDKMVQKRNLTKEKIIEASFLLADEIGLNQITFQKIAEKLDIKYPSLYNHFANIEELKIKMTIYFLNNLNSTLMERLIGKVERLQSENLLMYIEILHLKTRVAISFT